MKESMQILPEWAPQDAVLLAWPHEKTDWLPIIGAVRDTYRVIIEQIARRETVLLLIPDEPGYEKKIPEEIRSRCRLLPCPVNDTWCRDTGPISLRNERGEKQIADFSFNAWGMKYPANHDNLIVRRLCGQRVFAPDVQRDNSLDMVLEGGAIETNGEGLLLSTDSCLLEPNRNPHLSSQEIYRALKARLGCSELLSLRHGRLPGDDTDGHIDTLVRFVNRDTIVYVAPTDPQARSYRALLLLERELQSKALPMGIQLIPLPDVGDYPAAAGRDELLPATYANFLFINGAVLLPIYLRETDAEAVRILQLAIPDREVVPVDCSVLVEQHGSLHCISMQIPRGFLSPDLSLH